MMAPASTRTPAMLGFVSLSHTRVVLHVRVLRIVRAAGGEGADERLQLGVGRDIFIGLRVRVRRIVRDGFPDDGRFGPTGGGSQATDSRYSLGIKPNAKRHGCVLHKRRTQR